jgi:hypothetical protein
MKRLGIVGLKRSVSESGSVRKTGAFKEGARVLWNFSTVNIPEERSLFVEDIKANLKNKVGPKKVRQWMRMMNRREYPVETVSGKRVTGVREGRANQYAEVPVYKHRLKRKAK